MKEDLDFKKHPNRIISIQDNYNEVNINDSKWDFIFENSKINCWPIYFTGWRLDFIYKVEINNNLKNIIEQLSDQLLFEKDNNMQLLFKLKKMDRNLLNILWHYYEYPSIIFLKNNIDEKKIIEKYTNKTQKMNIEQGLCIISKMDPESDVLWVEKSNEIIFHSPHGTDL